MTQCAPCALAGLHTPHAAASLLPALPPPQARLTALEDFRPRGFFYRSSGPTSLYVAWVYPSPEEGPRSGRQLVQVVHK